MKNSEKKATEIPKKPRATFPRISLEKSISVARAIQDKYAGKAMPRLSLAEAMGIKPLSTQFRDLLSCSYKFGLTEGTEKADRISLTDLGISLTLPKTPELEIQAKIDALLTPQLFGDVLKMYKNKKFPDPEEKFFQNVLITDFFVPQEHAKEAALLIKENGMYAGVIRNTSGSLYVRLDELDVPESSTDGSQGKAVDIHEPPGFVEIEEEEESVLEKPQQEKPKPIFIAHGKNKGPLDQLKKLLEDLKIPYKVAIDEPNSGKLIPEKVKALMRECGSAIFIFTGNEGKNFVDKDGLPELNRQVPNLNVVFELGAASMLYDDRVIIFKEVGVEFASDFSSIGYISFEEGNIQSKSGDLIKELVALGFIKITTAG